MIFCTTVLPAEIFGMEEEGEDVWQELEPLGEIEVVLPPWARMTEKLINQLSISLLPY